MNINVNFVRKTDLPVYSFSCTLSKRRHRIGGKRKNKHRDNSMLMNMANLGTDGMNR